MRRGVALAALLLASTPAGAVLESGTFTDPVVCTGRPGQTYALFLPKAWSPERATPVLFVLDARGRGAFAAGFFRDAAERHGWVLASSNTSASDVEARKSAEAFDAMWGDLNARLRIDASRTYLAGFSGTARFATIAGIAFRGRITGILGAGAGFSEEVPPRAGMPFVYFGAVGDEDFNFVEMRRLDRRLTELKALHRIVYFEGGHRWPPSDVAADALEWFEACATQASCPGAGVPSKGDAKRRRVEAERDEQETRAVAAREKDLLEVLRKDPPVTLEKARASLRLADLVRRARSDDREDAKAARRALAALRVRAGFTLAAEYDARGDAARAALCREIADAAAWASPDARSAAR